MFAKLEEMDTRYSELERLLQNPDIVKNPGAYSQYLKEHGGLSQVVALYRDAKKIKKDIEQTEALLKNEQDPEMLQLAQEELPELKKREEELYIKIQDALLSKDDEKRDKAAIMEIRAGTGGEEAALFASSLYHMYCKFAETVHWKVEVLDSSPTDLGGYKEVVFAIKGKNAFAMLKNESGGHRVQRVPVTEASGRIHTSACTVAVLPEAEETDVQIDPKDLEIEAKRATGPGGQNVNKTSSAIRITHIPTGIIVSCQDTPEQYKNKMKAMRMLRTRLQQKMLEDQHAERNELRRTQQGSGERSDRVRTYNFPQNRVTDHRINFTMYNLAGFMEGDLRELLENLQKYEREKRLANLQ